MFGDMVTGPKSEWRRFPNTARSRRIHPMEFACIVFPEGDGRLRGFTVWEKPGQRGDVAAQVMMPLFDSGVVARAQNSPEPVRPGR